MSDTDILKRIVDPDPKILRSQFAGHQAAGQIKVTGCPHPTSAIQQYVDETGHSNRQGRPTNLFMCTICNTHGRLVFYDGVEAKDG